MGLIVLISIVLHGVTVTPVMRHLDRRRGREPPVAVPLSAPAADAGVLLSLAGPI